jgi:23S rRNA (adenine2030-N6)-methyltransferase
MQYRHAFHAGNFADVHKHIALLQLIEALQKKAKGFLYLDTHAGAGLYDLDSEEARHSAESGAGIARLLAAPEKDIPRGPIRNYLAAISRIRQVHGGRRVYPGSPLLAAAALRSVDAAVCVESQAPVARLIQRTLDGSASLLQQQPLVLHADGYRELKARLPPASRRGLVLIDPPYESAGEEQQLATALHEGLLRFETGVFAVWYPIKKERDSDLMTARLVRGVRRPVIAAEFCLHVADNTASLNGSGLLVVNPPFEFDTVVQTWQEQLGHLLGAQGGNRLRWLVRESRPPT